VGDFLRFIRSVTAGTDNGNITVIISELGFPASKSTDTDTQVLCTFNLCKIRVLFAIVDSIQLELLAETHLGSSAVPFGYGRSTNGLLV
jgi:hypothetical protein